MMIMRTAINNYPIITCSCIVLVPSDEMMCGEMVTVKVLCDVRTNYDVMLVFGGV